MMLSDLDLLPSNNNWTMRVGDLLNNMGFSIVWQNQGVGNEIAFSSLF